MPVIVLASSKGGAGKTTLATVLASELARQATKAGVSVGLIDADPNQHSAKWARKEGCPHNIKLYDATDEDSVLEVIEAAENDHGFVIVDLEGTASIAVGHAISRADYVILPLMPSQDDADEMLKTIKLVRNQIKALRRDIPFSVLFTRISPAIVTRTLRSMVEDLQNLEIDIFATALADREAYRAMKSFGGTVNDLNPKEVSGIEKAAKNANEVTAEVLRKIKMSNQPQQEKEMAHG